MKSACKNHPHKSAIAKGMCSACYMRERRAKKRSGPARAPSGQQYDFALKYRADWQDRFDASIDRSGDCHIWRGTTTAKGYGLFSYAYKSYLAHRLVRGLHGGDLLTPVVMHTCDNPSCVNPEHLRDGSYADNVADMDAKERRVVGKAGEHLKDRASHPRAVAVVTPEGEFASAALAAERSTLSARTIQRYCQKRQNGYRYA